MAGRDSDRDEGRRARPAASSAGTGAAAGVRTVVATEILGASGMLRIDLDGEIYTLRLTRNHRLILTK